MNAILNRWKFVPAICVGVCLLALTVGCGDSKSKHVKTEYGKISGSSRGQSINGTSVFAELLEQRGHTVRRHTRVASRLNRCDTIIWFPESKKPPSAAAVEWLENWLTEDDDRKLIYVDSGFRCNRDFWAEVVQNSSGAEQEKARRKLAESSLDNSPMLQFGDFLEEEDSDGLWFERTAGPSRRSSNLSGAWARGVDEDETTINARTLSVAPDEEKDLSTLIEYGYVNWDFRDSELKHRVLLRVDRKPFAFSTSSPYFDSEVIVISNASFLLNYSLTKKGNRQLAMKVAQECRGEVGFLETGPSGARVSNGSDANRAQWAWISKRPMNYIVPHLLLWGVLFCFVYFPLFGRARRVNFSPEKKFKDHVSAFGEMLKQTKSRDWAVKKVREFRKLPKN